MGSDHSRRGSRRRRAVSGAQKDRTVPMMQPASGLNSSIGELAACIPPHLANMWMDELRLHDSDPSEPLPYLQAGALARVVVDAYVAKDSSWLPQFFTRLEDLLTDPANADKQLLVIGVIEGLQNLMGWARVDQAPMSAMLGPRSKAEWDGLNATWGSTSPGTL
jgi:hypothetical protein